MSPKHPGTTCWVGAGCRVSVPPPCCSLAVVPSPTDTPAVECCLRSVPRLPGDGGLEDTPAGYSPQQLERKREWAVLYRPDEMPQVCLHLLWDSFLICGKGCRHSSCPETLRGKAWPWLLSEAMTSSQRKSCLPRDHPESQFPADVDTDSSLLAISRKLHHRRHHSQPGRCLESPEMPISVPRAPEHTKPGSTDPKHFHRLGIEASSHRAAVHPNPQAYTSETPTAKYLKV